MTAEEARIFLKLTGDLALEDAFDDAVFEIRQFLLTKPTLLKTFQQKQKKLAQLLEAYEALGGAPAKEQKAVPVLDFAPLNELEWHLMQYHKAKNELKQRVAAASIMELIVVVDRLIELERMLIMPFSEPDWTDEMPVIGRDMDAMLMQRELKTQSAWGRSTLAELWEVRNELSPAFLLELKRLSLLKNYLYE